MAVRFVLRRRSKADEAAANAAGNSAHTRRFLSGLPATAVLARSTARARAGGIRSSRLCKGAFAVGAGSNSVTKVYRDLYLSGLGIAPNATDVSLNTLLVYAFTVFQMNWWLAPLLFLAIIALSAAASKSSWAPGLIVAIALAGVGAFFVLYAAAARTADRVDLDVRLGRVVGISAVTLSLRDGGRSYDQTFGDVFTNEKSKTNAYLVDENASSYCILIQPEPLDGSHNLPVGFLYVVPKSDILHIRSKLPGRHNAL